MKIIYIALIQSSSKRFDIQLLPRQTKFHSETISTSWEVYSESYLERRINTRIQQFFHCLISGTQTRLGERVNE